MSNRQSWFGFAEEGSEVTRPTEPATAQPPASATPEALRPHPSDESPEAVSKLHHRLTRFESLTNLNVNLSEQSKQLKAQAQAKLDLQAKQLKAQAQASIDPKHKKIAMVVIFFLAFCLGYSMYTLIDQIIMNTGNPPVRNRPSCCVCSAVMTRLVFNCCLTHAHRCARCRWSTDFCTHGRRDRRNALSVRDVV